MSDDLITRMAEAAYTRRMASINAGCDYPYLAPFTSQRDTFQAEVRAEMEMLRDMVLADRAQVRDRRLSLF